NMLYKMTMKRTNFLNDLLMDELAEIFDAESHMARVLPKMAEASQSAALKIAFQDHLEDTRDQAVRLRDVFTARNSEIACKTMRSFVQETEETIAKMRKSPVRDAALIEVAQRVEQYEITRYKIAREHAADFGHTKIVEVLTETLNEERAMKFHLNE